MPIPLTDVVYPVGAFNLVDSEDIRILTNAGDPNGAISGELGDVLWDSTNGYLYINTDGAMAWQGQAPAHATSITFATGLGGTIPAATTDDCADFNVVVPRNCNIKKIKATVKTKPSSDTTIQVRRTADGDPGNFVNWLGTVIVETATDVVSYTATPGTPLDADEGDLVQISITGGGGDGTNLLVELAGDTR
jgi:hypothetical protein